MTLHINRNKYDRLCDRDREMVIEAVDAMVDVFRNDGWKTIPGDDRLADVESFIGAFVADNRPR